MLIIIPSLATHFKFKTVPSHTAHKVFSHDTTRPSDCPPSMSESPLDNDELFALEVELTSLDSFLIEICAFSQESVNLEALLNYTRGIREKTDALHFTSTDNLAEAPIQNPDFTKKLETYDSLSTPIDARPLLSDLTNLAATTPATARSPNTSELKLCHYFTSTPLL